MVGLERGLEHCPTENRDGLAEKAIPSLLDKIEPCWQIRSSGSIKGGEGTHRKDVSIQSRLGLASHCWGVAETWYLGRQVYGGEVQGEMSKTAITHVESVYRTPPQGFGVH